MAEEREPSEDSEEEAQDASEAVALGDIEPSEGDQSQVSGGGIIQGDGG
jgi:hypothetical protein